MEAELMFVNEVGQQVAGLKWVGRPAELGSRWICEFTIAAGSRFAREVSEMDSPFLGACDVPASEPESEWDLMSYGLASEPI